MKKTTKRAGFTVVELVIVIAVVAVLAAVMIPTFSGIMRTAQTSADTQVAHNVTMELISHSSGERIEDEATLLSLLEIVDPEDKLLRPQSSGYGNHFWFEVASQTVIVATADEIAAKAVTPIADDDAGADPIANTSFRDVYGTGHYLITSGLSCFNAIDTLATPEQYGTLIADLTSAKNDQAKDKTGYGKIAAVVLDKLASTTVRTESGIFYYANATTNNEYFVPGVTVLSSIHVVYDGSAATGKADKLAPTPVGTVLLPSTVVTVQANAMDYSAGPAVMIQTELTAAEIAGVFGPSSTNATILDKDGNKYTVEGNKLENEAGDSVGELMIKLPFDDFEIGYDLVGLNYQDLADEKLMHFNGGKLYIFIKAENVDLFAKSGNATSEAVVSWVSSDTSIVELAADGRLIPRKAGVATITVTANNKNGTLLTKTLTVCVNAPTGNSANIKIGDVSYKIEQDAEHMIDWLYNGTSSSELAPTLLGTPSYKYEYAKGTAGITVSLDDKDASMFNLVGNKLTKKNQANGTTTFKVSVDGFFTTTFTVNIVNNNESAFQVNFHDKDNDDVHRYYIGTGNTITLGQLFGVKTGRPIADVSYKIYVKASDGALISVIDKNASSTGSVGVTVTPDADDWKNTALQFSAVDSAAHTVYITLQSSDSAYSLSTLFHIVDAKNVSSWAELTASANAGVNFVLQGDIKNVTSGTLNLGARTLYGNGYIIEAKGYTAPATGTDHKETVKWCTNKNKPVSECSSHWLHSKQQEDRVIVAGTDYKTDQAMILLNGGTIDNIYLDGPVYPTLQYYETDCETYAHTPYYVSGIKAIGNSTIKNSYVSGFRQPVKVDNEKEDGTTVAATKLTLNNVTLRGGNLANLLLTEGDLNLTNVTTIQDQGGMKVTVGTDAEKEKYVLGMGISLEKGALDSTITIDGLHQYNWVKQGANNLPVITTKDGKATNLSNLFEYLYTGMSFLNKRWEYGEVKPYIHKDQTNAGSEESVAKNNYANAGLIFVELGSYDDLKTIKPNLKLIGADDIFKCDMNIAGIKNSAEATLKAKLGDTAGGIAWGIAKGLMGDIPDCRAIIWSYKDGREWSDPDGLDYVLTDNPATEDNNGLLPNRIIDTTTTYVPSGLAAAKTNFGVDDTVEMVPLVYRGYYDAYGAYANEYKANLHTSNVVDAPLA